MLLIDFNGTHVHLVLLESMSWVINLFGFLFLKIYFLASTYRSAHVIYIWDRNTGSLVKILEGPKEEFIDVDV